MSKWTPLALLFCVMLTIGQATPQPQVDQVDPFAAWDLFIETDQPLAAYQVELVDETGQSKIIGIEGNAALPFGHPPYYDQEAAVNDRVILADFSTQTEGLPTGRVRVGRIHVKHGDQAPQWRLRLMAAATVEGRNIRAGISLIKTEGTK